jgi:hypothetical protein
MSRLPGWVASDISKRHKVVTLTVTSGLFLSPVMPCRCGRHRSEQQGHGPIFLLVRCGFSCTYTLQGRSHSLLLGQWSQVYAAVGATPSQIGSRVCQIRSLFNLP